SSRPGSPLRYCAAGRAETAGASPAAASWRSTRGHPRSRRTRQRGVPESAACGLAYAPNREIPGTAGGHTPPAGRPRQAARTQRAIPRVTTNVTIVPASAAPIPQAERSTLSTIPRNRAGQVSATSIEPTAHSPFRAKRTTLYIATKTTQLGRQRHQRHRQREHCDIERQDVAPAVPVGQPWPEIEADNADEQRDLHPAALSGEIDRKLPHQQRRDQREYGTVHAIKAPAETIGTRDVPVARGQPV